MGLLARICFIVVQGAAKSESDAHQGQTPSYCRSPTSPTSAGSHCVQAFFLVSYRPLARDLNGLTKRALEDLRGRGGLGGGLPLVPRFRDGDDAVRYVSSARDVEAVLEDVGEVVPPPAPVVEE